jgi:hypothetical protein
VRYSVACTPAADGQLAALWITARDRASVTAAALEIEKALSVEPLAAGESREGNQRILFIGPLGVRYLVEPEDLRVVSIQFWTV